MSESSSNGPTRRLLVGVSAVIRSSVLGVFIGVKDERVAHFLWKSRRLLNIHGYADIYIAESYEINRHAERVSLIISHSAAIVFTEHKIFIKLEISSKD